MTLIVPPGGFSGFSQMTPASRAALGTPNWRQKGLKRKKTRRKSKAKSRRAIRSASPRKRRTSGRKMKFGSPAWQKKYKVGKFRA